MNLKIMAKGAAHLMTKRYAGPFWYRRAWLKKTQYYTKEEIHRLQIHLMRKLVKHSYDTVPFYKKLFDGHGVDPDLKSIEEIKKIPLLNKADVLNAGESIISKKYFRFMNTEGLTGGTTGTPLRIQRNLFAVANEHAFVRRQWDWAGLTFRDKAAFLSGRQVVSPERTDGQLYAYDPFMRELILSNYHLSRKNASQFFKAIVKYKISVMAGYTSSIYYFAQLCRELGFNIKLKAVLTTSEIMNDHMKETIEEVFCCKVYDHYGAAERVCYVFSCEKGVYHIQEDYGYTELLPESGHHAEGKFCRIISTGFWNWAMPLLRYDTGDLLELEDEECDCGRCFRRVKRIIGRTGTFIQTPSGKRYSPTLMARASKMAHNILQTQIIQDRIDHILVTYIPNSNFSQEDLSELKQNMREFLPSELGIDYQEVESVIKTKSGKTNLIVSRI